MEADRNRSSEDEKRKVGGGSFLCALQEEGADGGGNWVVRGGVSKCD